MTDILQFFRDENIYDCEENSLEPLKQAIIVEIECLREDNERLREERDSTTLDLLQHAKWLKAVEIERDRLRDALRGLLHHEIAHVGPYAGQRVIEARAALGAPT